jgi:outer membrane receptor protein involved in Fe transport
MSARVKFAHAASVGLALVAFVTVGAPARLEAQSTAATLIGSVIDQSGAVVPGATVTAINDQTGFSRSVASNEEGRYRIPALPPGTYTVRMELDGFKTVTQTGIVLTVDQTGTLDFSAELATVAETVTVTGESPVVETTKAEISGVVTQEQIDTLPLNSRQYLNLALLMPGTSQDGARPFYNNVNISSGATFYSSAFVADGMVNTWAEQGEPRQDLPQDAVQEFKVINTQAKAEYGLATAGVITVVTKSGTNEYHGNVFEYYRGKALNQNNHFNRELGLDKPDFFRHQFGGSIGGPIIKDKSHFFVAFERTDQETGFTVNTGGAFPEFDGVFPREFWRNLWSARWDHTFSQDQVLFVRYAQEDEFTGCFQCGGITRENAGFDLQVPRRAVVAGLTSVLGPQALNEFKFQYAFSMYQISPSGTPIFTKVDEFPQQRIDNVQRRISRPNLVDGGVFDELGPEYRYEFRDDFSYFIKGGRGEHNLKMGIDYSHIPFEDSFAANPQGGTYTFATNRPFNPNDPTTFPILFSVTLPSIYTRVDSDHLAFYLQDDWSLSSKLTLNLGVRYDRQFGSFNERLDLNDFPRTIPFQPNPADRGDTNNWGPRFGFAYDPVGDSKTVIRGGAGVYYDNIRTLVNFGEWRNFSSFNIIISNPPYPDPYLGRDPLQFVVSSPPNVFFLAEDFRNPSSRQLNLGFERELGSGLSLNVDFLYTRVRDDRLTVDLNPRDPVTRQRPIPEFGRIDQVESISRSSYKGLYLRAERRFRDNYQFLLSYTLQKGDDNNPGQRIVNQLRRDDDFGPFSIDRRHMFVGSGFAMLPWDLGVSAVFTYRSSQPFSALAGRDLNGDGFNTDYVPGTTRNQGNRDLDLGLVNAWRVQNGLGPVSESNIDSSKVVNVDVRASKQLRLAGSTALEFVFQIFNLFSNLNLGAPFITPPQITNALSPSFGRILTAKDGRQAELAVRFIW